MLPAFRSSALHALLISSVLTCTGVLAAPADSADAMSFSQARQQFHERADVFRADAADVERARHAADSAKALSGPKVDLVAMQVEGRKDIELNLEVPKGVQGLMPGMIPSSLSYSTEYDLSGPRAMISANWPIYTGGLITAQQNLLEHKVREASAAQTSRLETKDAELAARYWGVQLARSVEDLRREMLSDEEEEVQRAKRFEVKGMISKIERMSVEVSRDAARRELIAAETNARVAESELMRSLRLNKLPELATPLFILKGDLGTLDDWQSRARLNSPVLMQIDAKRSQAEEGVRAAEAAFHPQVFAFGMKNLVKHYLTVVEPDWMVGIGVKFTLWDNRDRFSNIAASRSQVTQAEAAVLKRTIRSHRRLKPLSCAPLRHVRNLSSPPRRCRWLQKTCGCAKRALPKAFQPQSTCAKPARSSWAQKLLSVRPPTSLSSLGPCFTPLQASCPTLKQRSAALTL